MSCCHLNSLFKVSSTKFFHLAYATEQEQRKKGEKMCVQTSMEKYLRVCTHVEIHVRILPQYFFIIIVYFLHKLAFFQYLPIFINTLSLFIVPAVAVLENINNEKKHGITTIIGDLKLVVKVKFNSPYLYVYDEGNWTIDF